MMNRAVRARIAARLVAALLLVLPLTGCWDIKTVQDVNYFTGLGIDYVDSKYVVYIQQLDFSSIAKSDSGGNGDKTSSSLIGHASGDSFSDAILELYKSVQQTVFWGHLSTIVLSERLLKSDTIVEIFDSLLRSPEIRMTPWIFGTKEKIGDIFNTYAFFHMSPYNTLLYAPISSFRQQSVITPMRIYEFSKELREPGATVLLPSLTITNKAWREEEKPEHKLELNGYYALYNEKYVDSFTLEQVQGLKWMTSDTSMSRLTLKQSGKPLATLQIGKPKPRISIAGGSGTSPRLIFSVRLKAEVLELWQEATESELEKAANEKVRGEILASYRQGLNNKADLFNIEHRLYRDHYGQWTQQAHGSHIEWLQATVPDIRVDVQINDTGVFKLNRKLSPNR